MKYEVIQKAGEWLQRILLIGPSGHGRLQLLAILILVFLIGTALLGKAVLGVRARSKEQFTAAGNWITYGYDSGHENFNAAETIITPATAPKLRQKWAHPMGNGISDQPVAVNGIVYSGSWDGYVHATDVATNKRIWTRFIGQTTDANCNPPRVGVASSSIVTSINGQLEVLVGGGDANFYALNAMNGQVLWHTSLGSSPSTFIWDSPAIFNGSIYIGVSSFGDCPLIQSKFYRLDATNGHILNTFKVVPDGCVGGGLWGSPTIDESIGKVYLATGNGGSCSQAEPYAFALVELNTADLSFVDAYRLPSSELSMNDSDFGSTPTLFTTSSGTPMVGVANKNGTYYAFTRSKIGAGPVWKTQVAQGTIDCPQCGGGSISPSAWDGHTLFVGGGSTKIGKTTCKGSVRALNPDNGHAFWQHCMGNGPVLGSVTVAGATQNTEVVAACQGNTVIVMNASIGKTVARLHDHKHGSLLYGPATISNGDLFVGNLDGDLYAYSVNGR